MAALVVGARGFGSYDCARLRIHGHTTAVSEVHVVYRGAVLIAQPGMVHGIAWACGQRGLLGLLLSYGCLCSPRRGGSSLPGAGGGSTRRRLSGCATCSCHAASEYSK